MPNDITVTKNTTSGSERWDIQYTADQAGTIDKTLLTAGKLMDRNEKVSITIPSGTAGTPTATKGTVSSNSISVTPSVTNVAGFVTGGTKTGTAVTVSASELVSGTKNITASGTTDVTNYANASVSAMTLPTSTSTTSSGTNKATIGRSTSTRYINIPTGYNDSAAYYTISAVADGSATTPATTITPNALTISVDSDGLITASNTQKTQSVTPTVSAGYVSTGTAGTITVSAVSKTSQLSIIGATTYTPTTTDQTIASGKYLTGTQTISGDANLAQGNIKQGVTIFGVTGTYSGEGITLQSKTVSPTTSQQTVTADSGYDALSQVTVNAMPVMTLPTSASSTSSGTSKATISRSTSDQYINIPTGYNGTASYYKVSATPNGSATTPDTTIYSIPTISIDSSTGGITAVNNETQSVTPTVSAGYISSGTAGTITVSGGASTTLSTVNGATITPTTSNQTAVAAGKYTLGAITVAGDANLIPANIADGVTIFGVTGTHQGGGAIISTTQDSHGGDILTITTTGNVSYLQSKTVTPTSSVQTITPDSGYDGLSEVIINAVPSATGVDF